MSFLDERALNHHKDRTHDDDEAASSSEIFKCHFCLETFTRASSMFEVSLSRKYHDVVDHSSVFELSSTIKLENALVVDSFEF